MGVRRNHEPFKKGIVKEQTFDPDPFKGHLINNIIDQFTVQYNLDYPGTGGLSKRSSKYSCMFLQIVNNIFMEIVLLIKVP